MPVGTLVVPDPEEVAEGVGYGAGGTEFVGELVCGPVPPEPTTISPQAFPFAAVAYAIRNRLAASLGLSTTLVRPVANDRYKITQAEPLFAYVQFFTPGQPRDPALNYTDAGAGRLATPVGRRARVYLYTRTGEDSYGGDEVALFGADPAQTVATPPSMPGHFVAEELVFNSLNSFAPLDAAGVMMTLTPLHPLDASEEPERPAENDAGLVRSCLDWEIVYLMAIQPTEPAPA